MDFNKFDPKRPDEREFFAFDFCSLLAGQEKLVSAVWVIAEANTNPVVLAPSMLVSDPVVTGTQTIQMIQGGTDGKTYAITCTAVTTNGQTIVLTATLLVSLGCH